MVKLSNIALLLIMLIFIGQSVNAQKNFTLHFTNDSYSQLIKRHKKEFSDSAAVRTYLTNLKSEALKKGYMLASFDSVQYTDNSVIAVFYLGPKYNSIELNVNEKDVQFIRQYSRYNEKLLAHLPMSGIELNNTLNQLIKAYVNNGYPFASLRLSKTTIDSNSISADLEINTGQFYAWDDIIIKGDSSISQKLIFNAIGIKIGDPYSEVLLQKISSKIEQITYLEEIKPSEVLFRKENCELYLYLESVPNSSVNGIIGFQPNPITERMTVTGEINLKLLNVLNRGENLSLQWQSIQEQTQSLKTKFAYPYLFNTSFGVQGEFNLYKRDSSFLDLNTAASVLYFLSQSHYLEGFYQNNTSSSLSGGQNNPNFSNLGSTRVNSYGLGYNFSKVDYIPNPRTGLNIHLKGSAGNRKSQTTDTSEIIESTAFRGEIEIESFIPIYKRHVLRMHNAFTFYSAENIFQNELYRFGGLNSLRGFNEDELYASTINVSTVEYRYLLDRNSHVFTFYNLAWYENVSSDYYNDLPQGFGLGFTFSTKLGSFSIAYALGKQFDNPILFRDSKIHFGYIAYF